MPHSSIVLPQSPRNPALPVTRRTAGQLLVWPPVSFGVGKTGGARAKGRIVIRIGEFDTL